LNLLNRLLPHRQAAGGAEDFAHASKQEPQEVVDFGAGGDGAARVRRAGPLVDANDRLQPFDRIDFGPLQLLDELPGIDRQALDILPLPLGKQRIKRQAALAGPAGASDHHQLIARNVEIDILEIVCARAANADGVGSRWRAARCQVRFRYAFHYHTAQTFLRLRA
jgi:hypothetical protein